MLLLSMMANDSNLPQKSNQPTPKGSTTMKMKNTLHKTVLGLVLGLFTSLAAQAGVLYQQDFSSYSSGTSAEAVGWSGSYATIGGDSGWGSIIDQGVGTGPMLTVTSGWTHNLTTGFTGNETQITVQALMFPQWGVASVGLYSANFNTSPSWNGAGWVGTGPTMMIHDGQFSLLSSVNAGHGSSAPVAAPAFSAGNANFSMVIDVTTGLADGYFGSPGAGTLLINDFDLKGSQSLSQFRTDLFANSKIGVRANQGLFDNITVAAIPEPSTYAMLLAGMSSLILAFRRRRTA
jgi:hypothetical protein